MQGELNAGENRPEYDDGGAGPPGRSHSGGAVRKRYWLRPGKL